MERFIFIVWGESEEGSTSIFPILYESSEKFLDDLIDASKNGKWGVFEICGIPLYTKTISEGYFEIYTIDEWFEKEGIYKNKEEEEKHKYGCS